MRKILILLFSVLVFQACLIRTGKFILNNNTESSIYYQLLSDTVPFYVKKYDLNVQFRLLCPYDTVNPPFVKGGDGAWVNMINKYAIDSALHIFIFQTDKITDELIKNREYERLSFKVKELDSLNWTVVYRGQNKMKEDAR